MKISRFILVVFIALFIGFTQRGAQAQPTQKQIRELKKLIAEQTEVIEVLKTQLAAQSEEINQLQVAFAGSGPELAKVEAEEPHNFKEFFNRRGVDLGVQYRVMYNNSNLPTYGERRGRFEDPEDYDFFRQRFRLSLDVKPVAKAGGFAQFEFRNAWGVGPGQDGPAIPGDVAFNRLTARGLRYGYLYFLPREGHKVMAGILTEGDWVNDTLFSTDWDFNVGGLAYLGEMGRYKYRAQFSRLMDTLDSSLVKDVEGHLYSLDGNAFLGRFSLGGHLYFLNKDENRQLEGFLGQEARELWYALSASTVLDRADINGLVMLNNGQLDDDSHMGWALRGEAGIPLGSTLFSLLGIYTSGDNYERHQGRRLRKAFFTPQSLLGTGGYWQYTHAFSANGPSDVNDLGIDIGNRGFGLLTLQAKVDFPIVKRLMGQLETGWFRSMGESNNKDQTMGWELGGMLTLKLAKYLNLETGAAYASLGDWFHPDAEDIYIAFSRFQLEF
jgi:hypothetical protein